MKKIFLTTFCLLFVLPLSASAANLIFKSGFENGVYLEEPVRGGGPNPNDLWTQDIKGSDVPGFTWPMKLGNSTGKLWMFAGTSQGPLSSIKPFMEYRIETVTGYDGKPTRALYMDMKKIEKITQSWYYTGSTGEVPELYAKYRIKISPDVYDTFHNFQNFYFWKDSTTKWRFEPGWRKGSDGKMRWYSKQDDKSSSDESILHWEEYNENVPVPLGEWFTLEVYYKRDFTNGRILIVSDGQTVVDYRGTTRGSDSTNRIAPFGMYGQGPFHQWIDDIEVWDGLPDGAGSGGSTSGGGSSTSSSSGGTYTPRFCHQYSNSSTIPSGFGTPWEVFTGAKTLILKAFCNTTTLDVTAGADNDLLYTYQDGYVTKNGSTWTKYTMTGESTQGDWIIGEATGSIPMTASQQSTQNWLLSYSCLWTGTEWKCGCRTSDCTGGNGNMWQIQGIKR